MDMSPAYIAVTKEQIPDAENKIAIDRFHVSMYLNKAVDDLRKLERRKLSREQSQETKWTRFLWLRNRCLVRQGSTKPTRQAAQACPQNGTRLGHQGICRHTMGLLDEGVGKNSVVEMV